MSNLVLLTDSKTNPLDRARLIQKTLNSGLYTKGELANKLNKSASYISNHLRLLTLPEIVKDALLSGSLNEGHARALSCLSDDLEILKVFENLLKFNYSVRQIEQEVNKIRKNKREYGKVNEEIKRNVQILGSKLETEIKVKRRNQKIILSLIFPIGIISHQKIKRLVDALNQEKEG